MENLIKDLMLSMENFTEGTQQKIKSLKTEINNVNLQNSKLQIELNDRKKTFDDMEKNYNKMAKNHNVIIKEYKELKEENKNLKLSINNVNLQLNKAIKNTVLSKDNINREGRPKVLNDKEIEFVKDLYSEGLSYRKIAEKMDISHTTVAKVVKEEKEQNSTEKAKDQSIHLSNSFQ